MAKLDIARQRAEERNACADQYRHACDDHSVDASRGQESLDGDAAVYISMFETTRFELRRNLGRFARHLLDHSTFDRREIQRTAAQHHHRLLAVRLFAECQHNFKGLTPDNQHIDAAIELFKAVRLLPTGIQEIKRMVRPGKKTIHAHSAKD